MLSSLRRISAAAQVAPKTAKTGKILPVITDVTSQVDMLVTAENLANDPNDSTPSGLRPLFSAVWTPCHADGCEQEEAKLSAAHDRLMTTLLKIEALDTFDRINKQHAFSGHAQLSHAISRADSRYRLRSIEADALIHIPLAMRQEPNASEYRIKE